jgi:tRNA-modifying protein YgfZ
VAGPEAADFLQRMISNDVDALAVGDSCDALLLTPKARVIAPLRVWRRGDSDFLLLTEPDLAEVVQTRLMRARFAAKAEIEREQHSSVIVFGETEGLPTLEYGDPAVEVLDSAIGPTVGADELERRRIEAGTPAWGKEIDDRVLPAEAGLVDRAVSFAKGCYPGQEPIARLHYRGHANRRLAVLDVADDGVLEPETELQLNGKVVGRVTSAVPGRALAYVRVEVADGATVELGDTQATVRQATVRPA